MDRNRKVVLVPCQLCGCFSPIEKMAFCYVPRYECIMQLCNTCNSNVALFGCSAFVLRK